MYGRIGVELVYEGQKICFWGVGGQFVLERVHAHFGGLLGLGRNIDLAGRVLADDHHGQAGGDAVLGLETGNMAGDAAAQIFGKAFSVDDFCGHLGLDLLEWSVRAEGPAFGFDIRDEG
ncbi:hypothetical protein D9M68_936720 [compost metagenome]